MIDEELKNVHLKQRYRLPDQVVTPSLHLHTPTFRSPSATISLALQLTQMIFLHLAGQKVVFNTFQRLAFVSSNNMDFP
jgi:hypothetical protein